MKAWVDRLSEQVIVVIDAIALLVIILGTVEATISLVRATFVPLERRTARDVWLRYARWLVAALTFQLAADIVETSLTSTWEAIGRVGAIAVIRTFLNFFLDRDVEEIRARQRDGRNNQ
jgi:uncharacterized membrane protein